jgi:zinc finger protein
MGINYNLRCPCCDAESMMTADREYHVENFGSVLLNVTTCQKCGHKHSDVLMLTKGEPIAIKTQINSVEDLKMRVIKSGTATVIIPEFGAAITPGPYSDGYISNVEGILQRVEDALTFMLSSAKGDRLKKGKRILKKIRLAREMKPHFTLIIKDPFGNSALVSTNPKKPRKRRLTTRELSSIKFGQYVLEQKTDQ